MQQFTKLIRAALTALLVLAGVSQTNSQTAAEMRAWVGKYPASVNETTPYATSVNFFGHPEVKARIKNVLGSDAFSQIKNMSVVGPMEERDGWLIAHGCAPHMCMDGQWLLAINLASTETRACLALVDSRTVRFGASGKGFVDLPRAKNPLTYPCPAPEQALATFGRVFQQTPVQIVVTLRKERGTFVVPVEINGKITLDFTVDSGAAHVSVPADVFSTLTRMGAIRDTDIIGEQEYKGWDGSTQKSFTFIIRSLKVGDIIIENVTGGVAPMQGSLLLGQSFLERFKSWSIDNTKHVLLPEPQ
jgi:clan AA aspartic protease (TIGR02281 family)